MQSARASAFWAKLRTNTEPIPNIGGHFNVTALASDVQFELGHHSLHVRVEY